jgi:ubiquinone/menaquinone biosynthesis C-methylase UbiE
VTALDLAPNLVQQARARAAEEGLTIQVDEGDAENLPYWDASSDAVMSLIGLDVRLTSRARRGGNDSCVQVRRANRHG